MDSRKVGFLRSVYSLLQYHKALGIAAYPAGEAISSFLETVDVPVGQGAVLPRGMGKPTDKEEEYVREKTSETCEDIAGEVRSCTRCILHTKRVLAVPGLGGNAPRLLIVGGWLVAGGAMPLSSSSIFGAEEDGMVSRMLAAMGLPPEKVFITNVIKCAIPGDYQVNPEDIHTCFAYLRRQIGLLDPAIICAMGIVATKVLLKSTQPLSQLRGKAFPFAVSETKNIPLIPTYHPTFLLKNPDFKRATWEDLQTINKYLTTEKR